MVNNALLCRRGTAVTTPHSYGPLLTRRLVYQWKNHENVLIFVLSKELGKEVLDLLQSKVPALTGKVNFYHATLPQETRQTLESGFKDGSIKVLISTTALSLGFDKSDIHTVIHTYTPVSIAQYYQEFGRVGRSSDIKATAYLLSNRPYNGSAQLRVRFLRCLRKLQVRLLLTAMTTPN